MEQQVESRSLAFAGFLLVYFSSDGSDFALLSVEKKTPKRKKNSASLRNKVLFLFQGEILRRVCDYISKHPDTTGFLPSAGDAHL